MIFTEVYFKDELAIHLQTLISFLVGHWRAEHLGHTVKDSLEKLLLPESAQIFTLLSFVQRDLLINTSGNASNHVYFRGRVPHVKTCMGMFF